MLAQCFQLLGGSICRRPGLLNDALRFPPGGLHGLFLFLAQLLLVLLALLLDSGGFLPQLLRLHAGAFHLLPLLLQLGQHILKVLVALAHQVAGFFQNLLGKPQLAGNGKGIGLAGDADEQLVGGLQCLHVKFAGGIDNPLGAHGIELQLGIVGGSHHPAAHFAAELNQRNGKGGTFRRVRTGTQLIIQHQRPVVALSHHVHNGFHVAGKGGKALGNGLLIANVGQDGIKGRKHAAVPRRDMKAALCHQGQKTNGFQGNGFAAGVRAGDNHGIEIRAKAQGNWHHLLGVNQRVAGIAQFHPALVVHDGCPGAHLESQLCLGKNHIQLHQHGVVQVDVLGV